MICWDFGLFPLKFKVFFYFLCIVYRRGKNTLGKTSHLFTEFSPKFFLQFPVFLRKREFCFYEINFLLPLLGKMYKYRNQILIVQIYYCCSYFIDSLHKFHDLILRNLSERICFIVDPRWKLFNNIFDNYGLFLIFFNPFIQFYFFYIFFLFFVLCGREYRGYFFYLVIWLIILN